MLKLKQIASRLRRADGSEIAEAALVLPLVFTFILGVIWFGRAFNIYSTIQQAAQQGAITAARNSCATCGNGEAGVSAKVDPVVTAVIQADNLSTSQILLPSSAPNCGTVPCSACPAPWPPAPSGGACATTGNIYVCQNVQLNPGATPIQCGSVVSFQYPFSFTLPFTSINGKVFNLSAQAQSRMED